MGNSLVTRLAGITDEELLRISSANPNMRFEHVDGELIAMTPVSEHSAFLENEYLLLVGNCAKQTCAQSYGSSSGFKLPNGNIRSPDVAVILSSNPLYGLLTNELSH